MLLQPQNITLYPGDTEPITVNVSDADGNPVDVGGAEEIEWTLRRTEESADPPILSKTLTGGDITILSPSSSFLITLTSSDTANLIGSYAHRARFDLPDDTDVSTVLRGILSASIYGIISTGASANSFGSLEEADDYQGQRNNISWLQSDTLDRQRWLLDAMDYMNATYRWVGSKTDPAQPLQWPRNGAKDRDGKPIDNTVTPDDVKAAQFILANYARSNGPLLDIAPRGGGIKSTSVKVDVIEEEIEYFEGASRTTKYPLADGTVDYLLTSGGASSLFKDVMTA